MDFLLLFHKITSGLNFGVRISLISANDFRKYSDQGLPNHVYGI